MLLQDGYPMYSKLSFGIFQFHPPCFGSFLASYWVFFCPDTKLRCLTTFPVHFQCNFLLDASHLLIHFWYILLIELQMSIEEPPASSTNIRVENLPDNVDESFLKGYFTALLRPKKCEVILVPAGKGKLFENTAFIDLGTEEHAQHAIREANGGEVQGKRLSVSLALEGVYLSPEKTVYFVRSTELVSYKSLFDFAKNFGTVGAIDFLCENVDTQQRQSACVTYLTEERARWALEMIRSLRMKYKGMNACTSKEFVEQVLDPAFSASEGEQKRAVRDIAFNYYEKEDRSPNRVETLFKVLERSLNPAHMLTNCARKERFQFYLDMAEAALEQNKMKITQLSDAALDVAEELRLASMPSTEGKLESIRERLVTMAKSHYSSQEPERLVTKMLERFTLPKLLESCADEKEFRVMAFLANVLKESNGAPNGFLHEIGEVWDIPKKSPSFSQKEADIILQLNLDLKNSTADLKDTLRDYSINILQGYFGPERANEALEKMFKDSEWLDDILIHVSNCADPDRFALYASIAEYAHINHAKFHWQRVSDAEVEFFHSKELLNLDSPNQRYRYLVDSFYDKIVRRYGPYEALDVKTRPLFNYPARSLVGGYPVVSRFYDFLRLNVDEEEFRKRYFFTIMGIAMNIFNPKDKTNFDAAERLILDLNLEKVERLEDWLVPLQAHIQRLREQSLQYKVNLLLDQPEGNVKDQEEYEFLRGQYGLSNLFQDITSLPVLEELEKIGNGGYFQDVYTNYYSD